VTEATFRRPRDSQRARLYRAEDEVSPGRRLPTVEALQAYVDGLAAADWFGGRWGARSFEVRPGYGHRRATADGNGVLQMPRWSRTELVVLHEMAHCLTPVSYAPHGPEYAGVFLALVRRGLTPAVAQALEDAFARHGVRWTMTAVPRLSATLR
jgi:putative metallohydrolase (TIGR04338 family)